MNNTFRRDFDATRINKIVNHPEVFKYVAIFGQTEFDLSQLVNEMENYFLLCDEGGCFFTPYETGVYEVHTQFLPTMRGVEALKVMKEAFRYMFVNTDCMKILTKIPANNQPAIGIAKLLKAKFEFNRSNVWFGIDGEAVNMNYYSLHFDEWLKDNCAHYFDLGKDFHAKLDNKLNEPNHEEDVIHNINVGITAEMIFAGNVDKAIFLYNRWAKFAGYAPIYVVSKCPLIIHIKSALLQVVNTNDDFNVVKVF